MSRDPVQYVRALALPEIERRVTRSGASVPEFGSGQEVVAVGAQLAEFRPVVKPAQRSAVADCLLLAQLAANKASNGNPDVMAWYTKYVEVLQNVGWTTRSMEFHDTAVGDDNAGVHQAILPVLTAALGGAAVAATSLVVSVLKGLKEMDTGSPWITIFDRSSMHVGGAKFQLGSVDADEAAGTVNVRLAALAIEARRQITQVLFFKLASEHARLRAAQAHFDIGFERLLAVQPAVAARVQPFLLDNIGKVEL